MSLLVDRYAPSPTSDLHVGNLRTALAGWLLTRSAGGRWAMRVEDLDTARVAAAGETAMRQLSDLSGLGLDWDTEPLWQSNRRSAYADAIAQLGERTYECFCSRRDIAGASSAPHDGHRPYPGTCSTLNSEQAARRRRDRPASIRLRSEGASFTVSDIHTGEVSAEVDDFVLVRGDGTPAYNLAVVVDDIFQGVTRITRGADLLSSAPRQAWLTKQLGGTPAEYAHVGLVTNTGGARLAKRDGSVTLADLSAQGRSAADVLELLAESLGLGACRTAQKALAAMPSVGLPGQSFWAPAVWDGDHMRTGPV
ncbi:MAG: tRNA glutamyl-Q(34) synthetase GluQRS [Arachnia sp.]